MDDTTSGEDASSDADDVTPSAPLPPAWTIASKNALIAERLSSRKHHANLGADHQKNKPWEHGNTRVVDLLYDVDKYFISNRLRKFLYFFGYRVVPAMHLYCLYKVVWPFVAIWFWEFVLKERMEEAKGGVGAENPRQRTTKNVVTFDAGGKYHSERISLLDDEFLTADTINLLNFCMNWTTVCSTALMIWTDCQPTSEKKAEEVQRLDDFTFFLGLPGVPPTATFREYRAHPRVEERLKARLEEERERAREERGRAREERERARVQATLKARQRLIYCLVCLTLVLLFHFDDLLDLFHFHFPSRTSHSTVTEYSFVKSRIMASIG